jgi:dTDP-4-dehydrorhamnose reductase
LHYLEPKRLVACPPWTGHLAEALVDRAAQVVRNPGKVAWGTYHYCGYGETTRYEFAREIVDEARRKESLKVIRILPITTADYPTPADRPAMSTLDCTKIRSAFGINTALWGEGLTEMMNEVYS